MKTIAQTTIQCRSARHKVTLLEDGSVLCGCGESAIEQGEMIVGRILLGSPTAALPASGCAGLVGLIMMSDSLVAHVRGSDKERAPAWKDAYGAYYKNPVLVAALDRAENAMPERLAVKKALADAVRSTKIKLAMGKREFDATFKAIWDVPLADLGDSCVAADNSDRWSVPYMPGWLEAIGSKGLAVVDGKVVCGRDANTFFAVDTYSNFEGFVVRKFKLVGKRLKPC